MPGLDTTFLNTITREKFIPAVKNQMYDGSPLFNRLFAAGRVQDMTGRSLLWDVVLKKHASVGRFTGYDTFANQPINPIVQATLTEGGYYAALAISGTEKRKNTGNMEKLLDGLKVQHDNALATLKDQMYTDLFGTGAAVGGRYGITGLGAAVDNDNTYANINRSTAGNESWKANVDATAHTLANMKDPTTVHYMPSIMRSSYVSAVHDHGPDLIVMTKNGYNIYQDIVGVQNLQVNQEVADAGFGGVKFQGVTMVFDDFCTAKYIYFLSLQDWNVWVYPGANFDMPEEGWMRPPNQDAFITQIIWQGQLRLDSPWHQAVIQDAQES